MRPGEKIRVPRTTAKFVTILGRVLREHLKLTVTEHEQWEFELVANWSTPRPDRTWESNFEMSRYWGIGSVSVQGDNSPVRLEIRVMIEKQHWVALGYANHFPFIIHIWIQYPGDSQCVVKSYICGNDDEDLCETQEQPPKLPRRFAFKIRQPVNPGGRDDLVLQ